VTIMPSSIRSVPIKAALAALGLILSGQAALAQVEELQYASVPGWSIGAVFDRGNFRYCGATTATRGHHFRVAHNGKSWAIGRESGAAKGRADLDGQPVTIEFRPFINDGWAFAAVPDQAADRLRKGRTISIALGNNPPVSFSLNGVDAAMSSVQDCVQKRGVTVAQSQPPAAPQPAPKTSPQPPRAGACPGGEQALPESGLCPSEAVKAFLGKYRLNQPAQLHQGCTTWVNETNMAGEVLLYGALKCGSFIGKLDYEGGARSAKLTARRQDGQDDVVITVIGAEPDAKMAITRFARDAIKDPNRRRQCSVQAHPGIGRGFIFDLDPKFAKRRDGPSAGECGPYGENNGPNHWQAFAGFAWYMSITDAEHSVDVVNMVLLDRDTRGSGVKAWRIRK
jgi:hypothetical protein